MFVCRNGSWQIAHVNSVFNSDEKESFLGLVTWPCLSAVGLAADRSQLLRLLLHGFANAVHSAGTASSVRGMQGSFLTHSDTTFASLGLGLAVATTADDTDDVEDDDDDEAATGELAVCACFELAVCACLDSAMHAALAAAMTCASVSLHPTETHNRLAWDLTVLINDEKGQRSTGAWAAWLLILPPTDAPKVN